MFFEDIADFKTIIPTNANFSFAEISIYLKDVDRTVLKKYLGRDFLNDLQTIFAAGTWHDSAVSELFELIRQCSAHYAIERWVPFGQVNISDLGITINRTEYISTAWQWQIKDIQDRCNELGFNALEDALEYLEENIDEVAFSDYKASDEFKENNYLFVSSGKEFAKFYGSFDSSRVNFFKLRSVIRTVEDFDIQAVLLPDLFNDLKTKLSAGDTLGSLSTALIEKIKPAVVNLVIAKGINDMSISVDAKGIMVFDNTGSGLTQENKKNAPDTSMRRIAMSAAADGKAYLNKLQEYLTENSGDYPIYTGDSKYVAPVTPAPQNSDNCQPFYNGL